MNMETIKAEMSAAQQQAADMVGKDQRGYELMMMVVNSLAYALDENSTERPTVTAMTFIQSNAEPTHPADTDAR